ncbi:MAG: hypothetical protein RBR15_13670 [Sphaerochaeta sp.]|nr:hypothetical protein [Sphaerochaeta sp.]
MNTFNNLKMVCNAFGKGFSDITSFADQYGRSKKPIKAVMDEILSSGAENIVTEYEIFSSYHYMLSEVFQDTNALRQLRLSYKDELTPEGEMGLAFWEKNPAFWLYFSVKEDLGNSLWSIVDEISGEEHILYSTGIGTMQAWEEAERTRYLSLMLPNGQCLQTIGPIKYNRIPVSDFLFYCSLFKPEVGLKAILSKHFVKFSKVDAIATLPVVKHNSYTMGFGWQPFTLPEFSIKKLPGSWVSLQLGDQQKYYLEKPDKSMHALPNGNLLESDAPAMAGCFVRDTTTAEMGIVINAEVAYPFYTSVLQSSYPSLQLPKKSSVFISAALRSVSNKMDLPFPWKKFIDIIELKKAEEPTFADEMLQIQHDLEDIYKRAQETGGPLDIDAIAKAAKVDRAFAERMFGDYEDFIRETPSGYHPDGYDDEDRSPEE